MALSKSKYIKNARYAFNKAAGWIAERWFLGEKSTGYQKERGELADKRRKQILLARAKKKFLKSKRY